MPHFTIKTREVVHGVYRLQADSPEEARTKFESGRVEPPSIYESVDTEIESIVEEKEEG